MGIFDSLFKKKTPQQEEEERKKREQMKKSVSDFFTTSKPGSLSYRAMQVLEPAQKAIPQPVQDYVTTTQKEQANRYKLVNQSMGKKNKTEEEKKAFNELTEQFTGFGSAGITKAGGKVAASFLKNVGKKLGKSGDEVVKGAKEGVDPVLKSVRRQADKLAKGTFERKSQRLNVNNLDLDASQKREIQQLEEAISTVNTKLSDKSVIELAKRSNIDLKSHTIEETRAKIADQLNLRRHVVELSNKLKKLNQSNAPLEEREAVIKEIAAASKESTRQGTDIARQLRARRILADEMRTPMQRVFQLLDNAGVNPDKYTKAAANVDFDDPTQVITFYRGFAPAKFEDWLDQSRYASMLSSPTTHTVNLFGNLQAAAITPAELTVRGGIDFLGSKVGRRPQQYFAGEGWRYATGYVKALKEGVKAARKAGNPFDTSSAIDSTAIPLAVGGKKKLAAWILEKPTGWLEGMDRFFTTVGVGGAENALKYRMSKGGIVKDLQKEALEDATYRIFRKNLGDPKEGRLLQLMDAIPLKIYQAREANNGLERYAAKFTFPFVRTATNMIKQGIEYSPAGFATVPDAANKTEQIAKAITGSGIGLLAAGLFSSGRLTFSMPSDPNRRKAFEDAGMKPYSVKIGDHWFSYQKLHPAIAFNLAGWASVANALEDRKITDGQAETVLKAIARTGQFWADQSYLKNLGDTVDTLRSGSIAQDPLKLLTKWGTNSATQLIPFRALMGYMAKLTDPYQREIDPDGTLAEQTLQRVYSQFPITSTWNPAKKDLTGKEIENQNFRDPFQLTFPVQFSKEDEEAARFFDQLEQEAGIRSLAREFNPDVDKEVETQARPYLEKLAKDPNFASLTASKKLDVQRKIESNIRAGVKPKVVDNKADLIAKQLAEDISKAKDEADRNRILMEYKSNGLLTPNVYLKFTQLSQN